jgi:DNA-binding PadR family transcriptional regulator
MSLGHAILGFVSGRPLSGYDLKKRFDHSVGHFWTATQSQIYRTLKRMADDGWVTMTVVDQDDRPDRKLYHITDDGRRELHRWLTAEPEPLVIRHPWLVRVFFADQLSDEEIAALFEARAASLRAQRERYEVAIPPAIEEAFRQIGSNRARRMWQFTLDYGLMRLEAELRWIEDALAELADLPED